MNFIDTMKYVNSKEFSVRFFKVEIKMPYFITNIKRFLFVKCFVQ